MKLDLDRIEKYLLEIIENTGKIEAILGKTNIEEKSLNEINILALKYLVIEISEAMANVLQHLLAKQYGIAVKGYLDTVKKAHEKGIISNELIKKLKPFFDFRNSLIHRYWVIDDATFLKNLSKGYNDFSDFCVEIKNFLKGGSFDGNTTQ